LTNIDIEKGQNMKTMFIVCASLLSTLLAVAGGNVAPTLPKVVEISAKPCKTNKVYLEKDVDLMWQDQSYTDAEDGAYKREQSFGKVGNASYAARYCRNLNYAGHGDWRLPTSDELQHVHRKDGQVFAYFRDSDFWSSTPASRGKQYSIYVVDAYRYEKPVRQSNYIRCVRCTKNDKK
jgi:hypothetical protein